MPERKSIGERISELRKELKIQQDEFADRIGVSRQALSLWETGKQIPRADTIAEICVKFNVDAHYFYSDASPTPEAEAEEEEKAKKQEAETPTVTEEKQEEITKKKFSFSFSDIAKVFNFFIGGCAILLLLAVAIIIFVIEISPNVNETTVRMVSVDFLAVAVTLFLIVIVAAVGWVLRVVAYLYDWRKRK